MARLTQILSCGSINLYLPFSFKFLGNLFVHSFGYQCIVFNLLLGVLFKIRVMSISAADLYFLTKITCGECPIAG